eukprot:TRINITY_DN14799_c0_g1_i2.p3 TRINITY_DN14799_c0_g1~~TRINITY_DN14799_c0_g1_i2.p3  ORF type:complete len:102 (-),score=14.21 TRINITY_DN14799_c0_g1_i2:401-706(-)
MTSAEPTAAFDGRMSAAAIAGMLSSPLLESDKNISLRRQACLVWPLMNISHWSAVALGFANSSVSLHQKNIVVWRRLPSSQTSPPMYVMMTGHNTGSLAPG